MHPGLFQCVNPSRPALIVFILIFLAGCDRSVVQERADAIRERNARLDHVSKIRVMREVRKHWVIIGDAWFGRLADGSMLRLDSPVVTVAPVKAGKPFCCNWLGDVTITANRWQSHPVSPSPGPFVMKYQAIMESAENYVLTSITGGGVTPPTVAEMEAFQAHGEHPNSP
jgi:hypothetical protein